MADGTHIEWTAAADGTPGATFNPWTGCTKVSAACDHCYAESWAKRSGLVQWGNYPRRRTSEDYWRQPLKWNRQAERTGVRRKVFCASLADVFDNQAPAQWRSDLWALIELTPRLDWLLLTKRPQNIAKMLPSTWGTGWPNVWLGTTGENPEECRRIDHLRRVPAVVRFLSCEPLLAEIRPDLTGISWVICGGESGPNARPMHPDWARSLRDQCQAAGVPFFFKQWGEWAPGECGNGSPTKTQQTATWWDDEWMFGSVTPRMSLEMHRDDEPDLYRLGKKAAGALLDGRLWRQFPARGETDAR